jgi:hypothetical protein
VRLANARLGAVARLGRVLAMPDATRALVLRLYQRHAGWSATARMLNERGIETASGGRRWYPSTVRSVVLAAGREAQPLRPAPSTRIRRTA